MSDMTETAQQLVARLTGFTPNTVAVEMKHSFHIHRKGDKACYQGRRADVIYWDKNHTGVAHNPLYDEAKANAALYAAAADLHRHVVDLLAREAVLRDALRHIAKHWPDSFAARHARAALLVKP